MVYYIIHIYIYIYIQNIICHMYIIYIYTSVINQISSIHSILQVPLGSIEVGQTKEATIFYAAAGLEKRDFSQP